MLIMGSTICSGSYILCYKASEFIASGLVSLIVSTVIIPNIIFGRIILKEKIHAMTIIGAAFGLAGLYVVFSNELILNQDVNTLQGFILAILSTLSTSVGQLSSRLFGKSSLSTEQLTGISMIYGGCISFGWGIFIGKTPDFSFAPEFLITLSYLSVVVSAFVFVAYLKIASQVGMGKVSYLWILVPIVSLFVSSFYENLAMTPNLLTGAAIVVAGGMLMSTSKLLTKPTRNYDQSSAIDASAIDASEF